MQFTQEFMRFDGVPCKALIIAYKVKYGYKARIVIEGMSKTVTATHLFVADVHAMALRVLLHDKENSIC